MKRYGDNLPSSNTSEDTLYHDHGRNVRVIYGGCGVRFGTFPQRVELPERRPGLDILSLLGFKQNKYKEKSS
jgi:hypothetical protein